jgi:hypothetical protein
MYRNVSTNKIELSDTRPFGLNDKLLTKTPCRVMEDASSATDHSTAFLGGSLPSSVVGLGLRASLVGRSRGSLMAPDADTCFDIPLVISPNA